MYTSTYHSSTVADTIMGLNLIGGNQCLLEELDSLKGIGQACGYKRRSPEYRLMLWNEQEMVGRSVLIMNST